MNHRIKWLSSICSAALMLALVTACAEGVDDDERFSPGAGVTNTQLDAPELEKTNIKVVTNADGSRSIDVSWPVVFGAGGYLANVTNVTDPEHPIAIVTDSVIDGCHFSFPRQSNVDYRISVSTLGNDKLNNKPSVDASLISFNTFVIDVQVPEGMELSSFIKSNIDDNAEDEYNFILEAGRTYTLAKTVDCKMANVTVSGDPGNKPLVVMLEQATFMTQNGLMLKNLNIDMSDTSDSGNLISMSTSPSDNYKLEEQFGGVNAYVCMSAIGLEGCNVRNLHGSIITQNNECWAINAFMIEDCVIQFDKKSGQPAIDFDDRWEFGCVKIMNLKNTTFYNVGPVTNCYFIRYGMRQNKRITNAFGEGSTSDHLLYGCTFYKTFPDKHFGNNMPEDGTMTVTLDNSILYDISRPDNYFSRSGKINILSDKNNLAWLAGADDGVTQTIRNEVKEIAYIEDPNFVGPVDQMFDLTQPLGGVSFRPQAAICFEKKIGDPRWLE